MKTVIAAVNTKYIHMSLAPWYLKAACEDICDIKVMEFTINEDKSELLRGIYEEQPDILAFSCYIFNIVEILNVVKDIKKIIPGLTVVLGGPEVSFNARDILMENSNVDYVICSEGEERMRTLLSALKEGKVPDSTDGIALRTPNGVIFNPPSSFIKNLDLLKSPYTDEMLHAAKGKIAYFEASRGCPFSCSYCLSSVSGGVRRFSGERIKKDLTRLMLSDVRQIKFVDRTFNCNPGKAREIINFIMETAKNDKTGKAAAKNYHFEAAADLFDDETIALLSWAPAGLFQLEIGIQSFNEKSLAAATRKTDLQKCVSNIKKLLAGGKTHIHADLIAGLPYEGIESFIESFNRTYAIYPHCIQLGFLKLLRGSALRENSRKLGYEYSELPPYEVLSNPWLGYDDILVLKDVETVLDMLYNSGKFFFSIKYIIPVLGSPFNFFFKFSKFLKKFYPSGYGIPLREVYNILLKFCGGYLDSHGISVINELLKFDYFVSDNSSNPPKALARTEFPNVRELYASQKKQGGKIHFERFLINPMDCTDESVTDVKFDYSHRNPVTGRYEFKFIGA